MAVLPALSVAATTTNDGDTWRYAVRLDVWLPDISGNSSFDRDFEIEIDDIIDDLELGMMASAEARRDRWGFFTDIIYASIGDSGSAQRQRASGGRPIPSDVNLSVDLEVDSWIWTAAGFYRLLESDRATLDLVAGFRYTDVEQTLDWRVRGSTGERPLPGDTGSVGVQFEHWDAVIGIRGRIGLGGLQQWFLPYYLDVGTGDSDLTWQGTGGIGYARGRWAFAGIWRYLEYDLPSSAAVSELAFSGPAVVVEYHC